MTPFLKMFHEALMQAQLDKNIKKHCPECNSTIGDIQASGKVGCPMCYDVFLDELEPLLKLIQDGASSHCGKKLKYIHNEVLLDFINNKLRDELKELIKKENYSQATLTKNKIKELDSYRVEKKEIIKFIKRALEFGEYEGIDAGKEKINNLYQRLREDFKSYIL